MKKLNILLLLLTVPLVTYCQETVASSNLETRSGIVKIPGKWEQLNTADDSGQTYLKNKEGMVIAIAQNPKKAYPFFKSKKSAFENVTLFYIWDSDYRKENKFKTAKIKENSKSEYIIWKYNDEKLDTIFLFGSSKENFLNLLIYGNQWNEEAQISFLENLYALNKK